MYTTYIYIMYFTYMYYIYILLHFVCIIIYTRYIYVYIHIIYYLYILYIYYRHSMYMIIIYIYIYILHTHIYIYAHIQSAIPDGILMGYKWDEPVGHGKYPWYEICPKVPWMRQFMTVLCWTLIIVTYLCHSKWFYPDCQDSLNQQNHCNKNNN